LTVAPEEKARAKRKEIELKPVPRPPRPEGRISLFAALNTPIGLLILVIFLVANVYAGFEIAVFRHQPIVLACVVSAFVPVVGPLIFLCPSSARGNGARTRGCGDVTGSVCLGSSVGGGGRAGGKPGKSNVRE
jgi:hypothetical protein